MDVIEHDEIRSIVAKRFEARVELSSERRIMTADNGLQVSCYDLQSQSIAKANGARWVFRGWNFVGHVPVNRNYPHRWTILWSLQSSSGIAATYAPGSGCDRTL